MMKIEMRRLSLGLICIGLAAACGEGEDAKSTNSALLAPTESNALTQTAPPTVASGPVERASVRADNPPVEVDPSIETILGEYSAAIEARDLARLEEIWTMSIVEKSLLVQAWQSCDQIEVGVNTVGIESSRDEATVDFDQTLKFDCAETAQISESALSASLVRSPGGEWRIDEIADRGASRFSAPARLQPGFTPKSGDPREAGALEALARYESALERCDLDRLSQVWIMSPLERQILDGVCVQNRRLNVSIGSPEVSISGDQVSVDFTHEVAFPGRAGSGGSESHLTALMVERQTGEWAIWKMRSAN